MESFDRHCVSWFVFRDEHPAKLIERSSFNFTARLPHQIQIKMQIVQCNQAKPENFFRFDEVTNITARKFTADIAFAVFFYRSLVQRELRIF